MKVTREQILQKSISFFASNDYDRASLNEIAAALGITKGGIYHYFGSKDDLFRESVIYLLDQMDSMMADSMETGEDLKAFLEPFFHLDAVAAQYSEVVGVDLLGEYSSFVYLYFSFLKKFPDMKGKMERIYSRFTIGLEMLFREAQRKGEVRSDLNPAGLAFGVTAFIEGGMLISSVSPGLDGNKSGALVFENFWKCIAREDQGNE